MAHVPNTFVQTMCGEDVVYHHLDFARCAPTPSGPFAHLDGLGLEDFEMSGADPSICRSKCYCLLQSSRRISTRIGQCRRIGVNNLQRFIDYGGARS